MDHIRIDEGIKRGPRQEPAPVSPERNLSVALRPMRHIPQDERGRIAAAVLDRYINGEQVADIAPEYQVSDVTMYALLLREHEAAWKDVQIARALGRYERWQRVMECAADALSLARAREMVRSSQWELERLLARLYAQKQEVTHTPAVAVQINLHHSDAASQPPSIAVQQSTKSENASE